MAIQLSVAVRNARLNTIESTIGTTAVLKLFTGDKPANCSSSDTGTELASMTLPEDWMAAADAGAKALSGTWQDASANAAGTAAHFRLYASDGTTCGMQGTVSATGGGGDLTLDNAVLASGQVVTITGFTLTEGYS